MISLQSGRKIVGASILIGDKVIPLREKPQGNSGEVRCYFYDRKFRNFDVILRLDWGDLDQCGDPILDADIYKDDNKYKTGRTQWHHTSKTLENGEYVYVWKPENDELRDLLVEISFKLQTINQFTISGMARISPASKTANAIQKETERQQQILDELTGND